MFYTVESFCKSILGISYSKVFSQINKDLYRHFYIPKKNGKRKINCLEKGSSLAILQNKLLENYLVEQPLPVCVKGFKKGESYNSFLSEHIGARFYLRVDIKSFFDSITENTIKKELENIIICEADKEKTKIIDLITNIATLNGCLPQGACTSPMLSNIVMERIDQRINKYCQLFHVRYTRYADDMLFSSLSFDFEHRKWFLKKIKFILETIGLKLNYSKIKYGRTEMSLNGYVINEQGIRLSRKKLSDIRHIIAYINRNGHMIKNGQEVKFLQDLNNIKNAHKNIKWEQFSSIYQLAQYLCGYRAFLISILSNDVSPSFEKETKDMICKIEKLLCKML